MKDIPNTMSQTETPARRIELEGCYNLRDIGGYATLDGRTTRWGTIFRADGLHRLPAHSQAKLLGYSLRTIIDLRRPAELETSPNVFANSSAVTYLNVSLVEDESQARELPSLVNLYKTMLDSGAAQFRLVFDALLIPGSFPALVHCTAGKDRTGMVIALLLGLAQVPNQTIAEDYALSTEYLSPLFDTFRQQWQQGRPDADLAGYEKLLASEPEMMLETLEYLDSKFGGARQYIAGLGFNEEEIEYLRDSLTE
ncbi:MAG: hypothetical protein BGO39_27065 [Chloroflexi bacterium 54-19]|nr:MAG: hypothetical protein BGO39_27065 [Chloroflexi bacterium 54-19]